MLTAFIGQALASTGAACDMSSHNMQMSHQQMKVSHQMSDMMMSDSTISHEANSMSHADMLSDAERTCCDSELTADCNCANSACSSVLVLSASVSNKQIKLLFEKILSREVSPLSTDNKSLYRPPIFA